MPERDATHARRVALVLAGGVGLGAYQAGAYAVLHERKPLLPDWLAGSSAGAVNSALIAGNAPDDRVERLRSFWRGGATISSMLEPHLSEPWRHVHNWMNVAQARIFGADGYFRPHVGANPLELFASLYDLSPMRTRIEYLVDFDRLNGGPVRVSVATTDIESGEVVVFDTAKGDRIGVDHLLASCGFLPEFAPVQIDGRILGDGGLSVNAPLEIVLTSSDADGDTEEELICFVIDLFARDGEPPVDLETALARKNDLLFGNQTFQRLKAFGRERELREQIDRLLTLMSEKQRTQAMSSMPLLRRGRATSILYLSYRAPPEEAGPEKSFDLSPATLMSRWEAGALDMEEALAVLAQPRKSPLSVIRRRPQERA
jgi:NTE family protein